MPKLANEKSHALGDHNYLARLKAEALAGNIVLSITPATVAPVPVATAWTRQVKVKFVNALGETHKWINQAFATTASIGNTSVAGTASIVSTTVTFVEGEAIITVSGDAQAWLDTETDTLTIANIVMAGITVTGGTSVETFTA